MKLKCPVCHREVDSEIKQTAEEAKYFPFCSRRCQLIDLGAWLSADYKITEPVKSPEIDQTESQD